MFCVTFSVLLKVNFVSVYFNDYITSYAVLVSRFFVSTSTWLPTMWLRAAKMRVSLFYCYFHGLRFCFCKEIFSGVHSNRRSTRINHAVYVEPIRFVTNFDHMFLCDVIRLWNALPDRMLTSRYRKFALFLQSTEFAQIVRSNGRFVDLE